LALLDLARWWRAAGLRRCYIEAGTMKFAWDPRKAVENRKKHGVTFEEAATCFSDDHALFLEEIVHPERIVVIATSERERLLFTVFAELHGDTIRIISARRVTPPERRRYEEGR
jgi:uncharacterized DUF497 family protein